MDNLTATALNSMIHKQFESWKGQEDVMEELKSELLKGCTDKDSTEEIFAMMIINSMEIAAGISAKVILEILLTAGVVKPVEEEKLRRNFLSVVK